MLSFSENLKRYRKEAGISQEELAAHMGITAQAVSKWECGLSYPDITLIIPLSELFGITADELLRGIGTAKETGKSEALSEPAKEAEPVSADSLENNHILKDDDTLRVVQCLGRRILSADEINTGVCIDLTLPKTEIPYNIDIMGSVTIDGSFTGNINAGGDVTCDCVNGDIKAGCDVTCDGVNGNVTAGCDVTCDEVGGNVAAGCDVTCDEVHGRVTAGGSVNIG